MKTLFYSGAEKQCALVERTRGRRRVRHLAFPDPRGALEWCIARNIPFIWLPAGTDPAPWQN